MAKRYWRIRGMNGFEPFFERSIPAGSLSERQVEQILVRMACIHLTESEIFAASLRPNASGRTELLSVHRNGDGPFGLWTDGNPYYTAQIEDAPDAAQAQAKSRPYKKHATV
jgi:hypothetical protein